MTTLVTATHLFFLCVSVFLLTMIGFSFYWYLQESVVLPAPPLSALYLNSDFDIETRINDLLSYMTLEEKIGQMALVEKNSIIEVSDISSYNLGALLSGMGAGPEQNSAAVRTCSALNGGGRTQGAVAASPPESAH